MNLAKQIDYICENSLGIERRKFSYTFHIPERRSNMDIKGGVKNQRRDSSYSREGEDLSMYLHDSVPQ